MSRLAATVVLLLGLSAAQSCENVTGPVAGELTLSLVSPNSGSDGAILLTITGPAAVTSASPPPGTELRVFQQGLGSTAHVAVTGPLVNGTILTIGVADVRQVTQYVATIDAVAGRDYGLRPLAGYSLTVSR
jgi:hypothetical protein